MVVRWTAGLADALARNSSAQSRTGFYLGRNHKAPCPPPTRRDGLSSAVDGLSTKKGRLSTDGTAGL